VKVACAATALGALLHSRPDEPGGPARSDRDLEIEAPRLACEILGRERDRHRHLSVHGSSIDLLPS